MKIGTIIILLIAFFIAWTERCIRENSHPYIQENNINDSYETTPLIDDDDDDDDDDDEKL